MEGPTPVSALIHAATMVAAGVYMVARLYPIFAVSAVAMNTVLLIGTITALIGATIALVQTDIKKVLAYSTISQLGYMMLGLGAGGRTAGMFHLVTHAMFKALLFLCAGSVIHALHHSEEPNDLRRMGGLGQRMRSTAITCGIGVLALAGFPLLSGFWSKDAILSAALENGSPIALFALIVGIVVAALTAFYAVRMWMLAFACDPRSEAAAHAHESPLIMTVPLWILAVPSAVARQSRESFHGDPCSRLAEGPTDGYFSARPVRNPQGPHE
jgi:NADH-quinone oxidoreductase subunit L